MAETMQEAFIDAVKQNNLKRAKYIIKFLETVNVRDVSKFHVLTYVKTDQMYEFLIQNGATFDATDKFILPASLLKAKHPKVALQLIDMGADVNYALRSGQTPLMLADSLELASVLIDKGANIYQRDAFNNSTMATLATHNQFDIMELLIQKGYDINTKDFHGVTDLIKFITKEKLDIVQKYLELGANPNISTPLDEEYPLHYASKLDATYTKLLIQHGANLNVQDNSGNTPLITASFICNTEVMKTLLENGADVNIASKLGKTPLMEVYTSFANEETFKQAVEVLLQYNPNILAKDIHGKTVFEQPTFKGRKKELFEIIKKHKLADENITASYIQFQEKSILDD